MLVDWELIQLCDSGLVKPFDRELVNPSSIDIRLGASILVDTANGFEEVDISSTSKRYPYFIRPNGFLLACTYESFSIPIDCAAELKLKSSRAREGLSHALAGHVDNQFQGTLTLELKNYSMYNVCPIYYQQKIGQLIVHRTRKPNEGYQNGDYSNAKVPVLSRESLTNKNIRSE